MPVPFVPKNFFDAALLLTVRVDVEEHGDASSGTGFLCQVMVDEKMAIALVSNRHVFGDGRGSIDLVFHGATSDNATFDLGDTITLAGQDFTRRYVGHPDPDIDLAAAVVNAVGEVAKGLMLSSTQIATASDLDQLHCGEQVWFVGYPDAWRDELHNLSLMRSGTIASLPRLPFDGRPEFVIDAQAFPGSSGSPVFAALGDEVRLIGVLAETRVTETEVIGASPSLGQLTVAEIAGLGVVIRSTEVIALLDRVRTELPGMIGP